MYGQPLNPKKTTFNIELNDNEIWVWLEDDEDPDNDDVRDVDHPHFEILFGNMAENLFTPNKQSEMDYWHPNNGLKELTTIGAVKTWLRSIGMGG